MKRLDKKGGSKKEESEKGTKEGGRGKRLNWEDPEEEEEDTRPERKVVYSRQKGPRRGERG